jgi:hypothetical protein
MYAVTVVEHWQLEQNNSSTPPILYLAERSEAQFSSLNRLAD